MSENIEGYTVKLCSKCPTYGRLEPNERFVSGSGRVWGYCKPCTYAYQKARRDAQHAIVAAQGELTDEVRDALEVLAPHTRGRPKGDNACPKCNERERQRGSSYCAVCAAAYRKERKEEIQASYATARHLLAAEEAERRRVIDEEFERVFGRKPEGEGHGYA